MMQEIIFSTAYLPPVDYLAILLRHQKACIEIFENYQKQSYRNRCKIAGPNRVQELSIPVNKMGREKILVKDLRISYTENWQKLHWRSIETAYNNSPFFLYYRDDLEPFYLKKHSFLLDFNMELTALILRWLKVDITLYQSTDFIPLSGHETDYRNQIHPKKKILVSEITYNQVFIEKFGFIPGMSVIDLIFNEGPGSKSFLMTENIR